MPDPSPNPIPTFDPESERATCRVLMVSCAELRQLAAEEAPAGPRARAAARLALQAIAERLQRCASRDLSVFEPAE